MKPSKETDTDLENSVLREISRLPSVNSAHIGVAVTRGIVTLSGEVDSDPERCQAEKAALGVRGVHVVTEEIMVRVRGRHPNDELKARQARERIQRPVRPPYRVF